MFRGLFVCGPDEQLSVEQLLGKEKKLLMYGRTSWKALADVECSRGLLIYIGPD